jgi:hypothetical protein
MTAAYRQALMNVPGLTITQNEYITFPHQTDFADYTTPIAVRNTPEGFAEVLAGRLISRTLFQGGENISTLVDSFLAGIRYLKIYSTSLSLSLRRSTPLVPPTTTTIAPQELTPLDATQSKKLCMLVVGFKGFRKLCKMP